MIKVLSYELFCDHGCKGMEIIDNGCLPVYLYWLLCDSYVIFVNAVNYLSLCR